jgi:hypothetical protein
MLLGNVTDNFLSGFAISVTTPMLSPEFRKQLVALMRSNKGNVPLTMYLYDPQTKYKIEFLSKKFQVAVTAEFCRRLKDLGIAYKAIRK